MSSLSMRWNVLVLLLAVPSRLQAKDPASAEEIFRMALKRQGAVRHEQIKDVRLEFKGQFSMEDKGEHAVTQDVWYRSADRSLRIRRTAGLDERKKTEFGVLGESGFWERSRARIVTLSRGNRDHKKTILTIENERKEFERILRLVLLSRLDDEDSGFRLSSPKPVRLKRDFPWSAKQLLEPRDRHAYHVVNVERPGEPRLELYVETTDFTVRKAVQYRSKDPKKAEWFYYFGGFAKRPAALGMTLPGYFSVHAGLPTDPESREKTSRAHGLVKVSLNAGLTEFKLKPEN
jgi:hypothetical protein